MKADFFLLPDLATFDGIGLGMLKKTGASLCLASGQLEWGSDVEQIHFDSCVNANLSDVDCSINCQ